jgi:hypothetical protein
MGYKLLGFAVWQGAKLYLRRHYSPTPRWMIAVGAVGLAVAGAVVAQRQASRD